MEGQESSFEAQNNMQKMGKLKQLLTVTWVSLTHELNDFDPVNSMTSYQGGQECDIPLELLYKVLI